MISNQKLDTGMNFEQWLLTHEVVIRMSCFFGILATMMVWEQIKPLRSPSMSRWVRWPNNLGLVFLNSLLVRVLFPAAAVGVAIHCQQSGWGIMNALGLSHWITIPLAIVMLDFVIYWQHVLVHRIPILWRIHRTHHADRDYDVTTGSRFHPFEIVFSMLIKFIVITIFGLPPVGVLLFEIILNGMAMFNHSNITLPALLDGKLRKVIVTPDMHRVHHSQIDTETNSNFGFNFSFWDRLFRTYQAQPTLGHIQMKIGLKEINEDFDTSWLPGILRIPFQKFR